MDTTTARNVSAWIVTIAVTATVLASNGAHAIAHAEPQVTIVGATNREISLVHWGVAQYDTAGIDIRPVTIILHSRDEGWAPCRGAVAYYKSSSRTIDMCNSTRPDEERRHWILHELGHAHTFDTMTGSDINTFIDESRSNSWNDPNDRWQNRGQERAADIVAWGLNPEPKAAYWMQELQCEQRAELFYDLTGMEIVHNEC